MTDPPGEPYSQVAAAPAANDGLSTAGETALAAAIVASSADAILALDVDGTIQVWNGGCEALFGWTAAEAVGGPAAMLLPAGRQEEFHRVLLNLQGTTEDAALETERLHRDGRVLPVSCRLSPMRDPSGAILGVCAVLRDNGRELMLRRQLEQTRQLAEARFEQSVVAQATMAATGVVIEANAALAELLGRTTKELLGRPLTDFLPAGEGRSVTDRIAALARGEDSPVRRPLLLEHAGGHLVETRVSVFPVLDDGKLLRLEAVVEDVSEAAAAQRELEVREARWRALAAHSSEVALLCDADGKLLFATEATSVVFGYEAEAFVHGGGWDLVHPEDRSEVRATWAAAAAGSLGDSTKLEFRMRHADGRWLWVEAAMTTRLADPLVEAMVVNIVDISERKAAEAVLEELAGLDTLTGLASRAPLMASLDAAFAAGRAGSIAVAVVDLTRMKLINDTYGHRGGDEVLIEIAQRLTRSVEGQGVVARIGGDRFAVLLSDVSEIADVFEVCAALLDAVESPVWLEDDRQLLLTASIGAAAGPAVDSGALLASAESALSTAKEGLTGPLHIVRAESASADVSRARLIEDLRRGLAGDELVVHFQPVISLSDGRPVAAEALVRWAHPEKGLLSPGAFIDAAEESGLIIGVGEVVLRRACHAAARWADIGGNGGFHVAVNLSAKQLTRGGVVDVVRQALLDSGAQARNLMLEVTESAVMSDVKAAVATLQELRDLGVAIAVDDFGTGYSSLTYLKQFPVTTLKIDRSFVSGLGKNSDDAAIVTSVINLARAMSLDCIAEGVETEQQRLVLQALGCRLGQGFLWSPGLDEQTFETWIGGSAASGDASRAVHHGVPAGHGGGVPTQVRPVGERPVGPGLLVRIGQLSAAGASLATVAAALNADQQLTPHGKRWSARSVAQLLATRPLH